LPPELRLCEPSFLLQLAGANFASQLNLLLNLHLIPLNVLSLQKSVAEINTLEALKVCCGNLVTVYEADSLALITWALITWALFREVFLGMKEHPEFGWLPLRRPSGCLWKT
jgi:hypothetical protein